MAEDSTEFRLVRNEKDITEIQASDKERSKSMTEIEKSNIRTEIDIKQILKTLTNLETISVKNLQKSIDTENLTISLKAVTDKQTEDLENLKNEVQITKDKVTAIEELPLKNSIKTKWILLTIILGNGVAFIIWLIKFIWTWIDQL